MRHQNRSAEEELLTVFVGQWRNSGRVTPGPFGPGGEITGKTLYKWAVGHKWLQYISRLELPGMGEYVVQGGVVYNDRTGKYDAYAANSLGNLMVYEGEWVNETTLVFLHTHPLPVGRARIVYRILPEGAIRMESDRLKENDKFETYFETKMVPDQ